MSPKRRGEEAMVPDAEFTSYYGRPILKAPAWKVPDVPIYLFAGGVAGVSATMSLLARLTGRTGTSVVTRYAAAAGSGAGVIALVHDLGRPERFLMMLRVLKPTSPLSVGSWILAPFSGLTLAAAASQATGRLRFLGDAAGLGAAVLGPAMATYTGVLLADTAVPAWHGAYPQLPFLFAGSALTSAAGLALVAAPHEERGAVRRTLLAGAALELAAARQVERGGLVAEPYRTGRAGRLLRAGRALTAVSAGLSTVGRRWRLADTLAGAAAMAGGLATRFGVFDAGVASAKDPKYVVVPQRERLAERTRSIVDGPERETP